MVLRSAAGRSELLGGIQRMEHAIGSSIGDPTWRPGMTRAVAQLRAAFAEHVDVTEGPSGLYAGLLDDAPRLARGLSGLVLEHGTVLAALDDLEGRVQGCPDTETVRQEAARVLSDLSLHRQRGADLVYEAYSTDIGGET